MVPFQRLRFPSSKRLALPSTCCRLSHFQNLIWAFKHWSSEGYGDVRYTCSSKIKNDNLFKQEETLQATLNEISKHYGAEAVMWLGRATTTAKLTPVISTGSLTLNSALGIGGLPKGRVVEIFGPKGGGKTTLALHVVAEAQKLGEQCVFIDTEQSLDYACAEALGVQRRSLLIARSDSLEQTFNLIDHHIQSETAHVIIVDRVPASFCKGDATKELSIPLQARLLGQTLRKATHRISANKTLLVFINQTTPNASENWSAGQEGAFGGNALKFYSSVRLNVQRTEGVKDIDRISNTKVKVVKNKLAPPFKTAEFDIEFGKGICKEGEVLDQAVKHGVVRKSGNLFFYEGAQIGDGRENAKMFLRRNADVHDILLTFIKGRLTTGGVEAPIS